MKLEVGRRESLAENEIMTIVRMSLKISRYPYLTEDHLYLNVTELYRSLCLYVHNPTPHPSQGASFLKCLLHALQILGLSLSLFVNAIII